MSASFPSPDKASAASGNTLDRLAARLDPPFPLRLLGFGLVYAWSTCIWDTNAISATAGGFSSLAGLSSLTWFLSAIITPIAFIIFAIVGRNRDLLASRTLTIAGPLLTGIGTLFVALAPYFTGVANTGLVILGALCTGVGPVALILLWINLFAQLDSELIESAVPASFATTLVITLIVPNLTGALSLATISLLPIASGVLYLLSRRSFTKGTLPTEASEKTERNNAPKARTVARMFALLLISYSVGCLLPSINPTGITPLLAEPWTTSIGTLFAIALSIAIVLFSRRIDLDSLYRWIIAPFALAIILAAFPNAICLALSSILGSATFTGLEIIMIMYFIRLANRIGKTPTFLLGLGECAAYTGVFIGFTGGSFTHRVIEAGMLDPKTASLMLVGIFICSTLLVPRRDIAWSDVANVQETASASKTLGDQNPVDNSIARLEAPLDSFNERCGRISREHGLSTRETEIFRLLAQGRSQPYIRDVLYLSKNTISTHTRHIYRKLDVHSKQELLDLIE